MMPHVTTTPKTTTAMTAVGIAAVAVALSHGWAYWPGRAVKECGAFCVRWAQFSGQSRGPESRDFKSAWTTVTWTNSEEQVVTTISSQPESAASLPNILSSLSTSVSAQKDNLV
jgi:hypothetical protein